MVWAPRVTVAAVIERDGRFLMVEERDGDRTVFNQPAGHLERGETLLEAVRREVLEETAHPFRPSGLVGVYRWARSEEGETYLRFCFAGTVGPHDPRLALDPDIVRTHWLEPAAIRALADSLRSPMVLRCLDDARTHPLMPLELLREIPS